VSRPSRPDGDHSLNREREAIPYSVDGFHISEAPTAPEPHLTAYPFSTTICSKSRSDIGGQYGDAGPLAPALCRILDMSFAEFPY
jgi:hypothetical protein